MVFAVTVAPHYNVDSVAYYELTVTEVNGNTWRVARRFNDFRELDKQILLHGTLSTVALPTKGLFGIRRSLRWSKFMENRRKGLQDYLNHLCSCSTISTSAASARSFRHLDKILQQFLQDERNAAHEGNAIRGWLRTAPVEGNEEEPCDSTAQPDTGLFFQPDDEALDESVDEEALEAEREALEAEKMLAALLKNEEKLEKSRKTVEAKLGMRVKAAEQAHHKLDVTNPEDDTQADPVDGKLVAEFRCTVDGKLVAELCCTEDPKERQWGPTGVTTSTSTVPAVCPTSDGVGHIPCEPLTPPPHLHTPPQPLTPSEPEAQQPQSASPPKQKRQVVPVRKTRGTTDGLSGNHCTPGEQPVVGEAKRRSVTDRLRGAGFAEKSH